MSNIVDSPLTTEKTPDGGKISFNIGGNSAREILRLGPNGEIYINGKLADTDKEVVDAFKIWLGQCKIDHDGKPCPHCGKPMADVKGDCVIKP